MTPGRDGHPHLSTGRSSGFELHTHAADLLRVDEPDRATDDRPIRWRSAGKEATRETETEVEVNGGFT